MATIKHWNSSANEENSQIIRTILIYCRKHAARNVVRVPDRTLIQQFIEARHSDTLMTS